MKREYLYMALLVLCIIGVLMGIVDLLRSDYSVSEMAQNQIENVYEDENAVTTAVEEEKISPNAEFALKKYYDECSHFEYSEAELPRELVNLTRQEVEDYYDDWEVEEFSSKKLVLCREINGYCNEHFLLKLDGDQVSIYKIGTLGDMTEYQKTDISRDYLPEEDIAKLEEGIPVYGEGKLSSVLEDYE